MCVTLLGQPTGAGTEAAGELDALHRQSVVLHDGGADSRAVSPRRRYQAHHHGTGQVQEDIVRLLLRRVRFIAVLFLFIDYFRTLMEVCNE